MHTVSSQSHAAQQSSLRRFASPAGNTNRELTVAAQPGPRAPSELLSDTAWPPQHRRVCAMALDSQTVNKPWPKAAAMALEVSADTLGTLVV